MLRTLLIATALLTTSGAALARDGEYGRVIQVEPHFSVSLGTRHHEGFRVQYESGGHHYWTHTTYRPTQYIVLPPSPPQYIVLPPPQPVYYGHPGSHGYEHKKHHWKGHRGDWDDGDRGHRDHDRESRRHDRHDRD